MSGHSHWAQIKHKKGAADVKRGIVFSRILKNVSIAARYNPDPAANPTLRAAIEKAKEANIPKENIERALGRGDRSKTALEPLLIEAYGPGGAALIVEALTDNKNRTMMEIRRLLQEHGARIAEPGSARWAFSEQGGWFAVKVPQSVSSEEHERLEELTGALEAHAETERIITNGGRAQ